MDNVIQLFSKQKYQYIIVFKSEDCGSCLPLMSWETCTSYSTPPKPSFFTYKMQIIIVLAHQTVRIKWDNAQNLLCIVACALQVVYFLIYKSIIYIAGISNTLSHLILITS